MIVAGPPPPINPHRTPVVFTIPAGTTGPVWMEIRFVNGTLVGRTPTVDAATTPEIRWSGGRGPTGDGQLVADGRYRLVLAGDAPPVYDSAREVEVDSTAPRVAASSGALTIPQLKDTPLTAAVHDGDRRTRVRLIVFGPGGELRAEGPWERDVGRLTVPAGTARADDGHLRVVVRARDRAGNQRDSPAVIVSLGAKPGPAHVVRRVRTSRPWVGLSFDDGSSPAALSSLLAPATERHVGITFCFNGIGVSLWSASLRARLRRAVADGVVAPCNHGYGHGTHTGSAEGFVERDMRRNAVVDEIMGATSAPLYRPPWGQYGPGERDAASALGFRTVLLWSVDPSDYLHPGTAAMVQRVANGSHAGSIVVMHAIPSTAAAFPAILDRLAARGLTTVTIPKLLASGIPTSAGG